MKCDICGKKIEKTFLGKIKGAIMKDKKGKKKYICPDCQKKYPTKEELLKKL